MKENQSELKLLALRASLQKDILDAKSQLDYILIREAVRCRNMLQSLPTDSDTRTISKEAYDTLWNYLVSIENENLYNIKGAEYLRNQYYDIETKNKILNQL